LDFIQEVGIENIYSRVLILTDRIISGLRIKGIEIITPVNTISERSAIIMFTMGSADANKILYAKLLVQNIIVTLRDGLIRISPAFFNTEEEIDRFLRNFI
jgi:cysteine desulfurase/selenocysteine lyase